MLRLINFLLCLVVLIILQVVILPVYLEAPFKPNFWIVLVCFLALRGDNSVLGACAAYFSGLVHDVFTGLYFGLSGISCLIIYLILRKIADQLYTESIHLLVVAVFVASLADALISLLLITLLSSGSGIYTSILTYMVPQALVTAFVVALFFPVYSYFQRRFSS
jgi:rod shape-determining protein MreD